MSSVGGKIYNLFFKKSSTYLASLFVGVFVFEAVADQGATYIFDSINQGRQWKDIKHLYVKNEEAQEE